MCSILPRCCSAPRAALSRSQRTYETTVGELAETCAASRHAREPLIDAVGNGLKRALYATYVSYLPPEALPTRCPATRTRAACLWRCSRRPTPASSATSRRPRHHARRALPPHQDREVPRHQGTAHFGFRQIDTGETHDHHARRRGPDRRTIPGWTHNITNIGDDELIVMLWANEIFDRARPDTTAMKVTT